MEFYREKILPFLIDHAMRGERFSELREKTLAHAHGEVLEIGFGTGLNLPHYPRAVKRLIALDPVRPSEVYVARNRQGVTFPVELVQGCGEKIPLQDASVDCVVSTWTLCSVGNPAKVMNEIARVLRPGGLFLFIEHGRAGEKWVSLAQDLLTPLQKRVAGGCHLNRAIDAIVTGPADRLQVKSLNRFYMAGPKVATFLYQGELLRLA